MSRGQLNELTTAKQADVS